MENTNDKFHRKLRRIRRKAKNMDSGWIKCLEKERKEKKEKRVTGEKKGEGLEIIDLIRLCKTIFYYRTILIERKNAGTT